MRRIRTATFVSEHGNIAVRDDGEVVHAFLDKFLPGKISASPGGTVAFAVTLGNIDALVKVLRECADELVELQVTAERQLKEWEADRKAMQEGSDDIDI